MRYSVGILFFAVSAFSVVARAEEPKSPEIGPFEKSNEFKPKSSSEMVSVSLEDAELSELVRVVGGITGRRFVVATNRGKSIKATVYAPEKITVAEAYQAFLAVLQANGLTVLPAGNLWRIVDTQDIAKRPTPIVKDGAPASPAEARYVTRIHRLSHVNVDDVSQTILAKLQSTDGSLVTYAPGNLLIITDTAENIRRMLSVLEEIDVGSSQDKVWFEPLFYVVASDVEKKLNELFDLRPKKETGGQAAAPGQAVGSPSNQGGVGEYRLAKLMALDRPNALVIVGTEGAYKRALEFIRRLDVQAVNEGQLHVIPLQYADATKIVPKLTEAVSGASPSGGAGSALGGLGAGARSLPGGATFAVLEAPVKLAAEETTNSILVTASEHDFASVREVIQKLDKPRRQVFLDAVVMDLAMTKATTVGVRFHGLDAIGSTSGPGPNVLYGGLDPLESLSAPSPLDKDLQALALGIRGPQINVNGIGTTIPAFGAMIEAMATTTDGEILQTPHIVATDNVPAEIHSQLNVSLQQNAPSLSLPGANGAGALGAIPGLSSLLGPGPASANYGKIGPTLKITPHLNESDDVRLDIDESISDTVGKPQGTLGTVSFLERAAKTTLTVRDRQTVVIGGLVRDKVAHDITKVPLLGDLPLIGGLFRHKVDTVEKSNLVLILTPYILRTEDDMRQIYERKMNERRDLIDETGLFKSDNYERPVDWSHTHGLLGEVRRQAARIAEQRRMNDALSPAGAKRHEPSLPIELPQTGGASGGASAGTGGAAAAPPSPGVPSAGVRIER